MKRSNLLLPSCICLICMILFLTACQKEIEKLPVQEENSLFTEAEVAILSNYLDLSKFKEIPNIHPTEQNKVFLGRTLFYDNNLSSDKSVSCGSCHRQELGFADDVAFSRGANNSQTERNSIALASFGSFELYYGNEAEDEVNNSFFWDERTSTIEEQLAQTIANPREMGMPIHELGARVEELEYMKVLYLKAFGSNYISKDNLIESIVAFVNRIESSDSNFDANLDRTRGPNRISNGDLWADFLFFTEAQNNGKSLFLDNCASCHVSSLSPVFRQRFDNMTTATSNGLDLEYQDIGLATHTFLEKDKGVFKIPSIRNISLTAPYMHDGRFETLEEVIDFYSEGIQRHPNLDAKLKDDAGNPKRMNFTTQEKSDLIDFLNTLNGDSYRNDLNLSNPFKY